MSESISSPGCAACALGLDEPWNQDEHDHVVRTDRPDGTAIFEGTGPGVILEAKGLAIVRHAGVAFTVNGRTYHETSGCWTNLATGSAVPVLGRPGSKVRTVIVRSNARVTATVGAKR